jgi:hypothetical protein
MPEGNIFLRLVAVRALAHLRHKPPAEIATELWPDDKALPLIVRTASAPAMTTTTGWAAELVRRVIADGLAALGPASAGAQLLQRCLVVSWDGAGQISAPGIVAGAGNASFVAEGAPIPVRQLVSAPCLMNPFKLATIAVLTREMTESGNAEALIGDALVYSCGPALDTALFDTNAATAARPAGLRSGIAASTPSASTDPFEAVFEDVATLVNAVSAVSGAGPVALICGAGRALMVRARFSQEVDTVLPIFGSNAVGNDLLAVAPAALVAALSPAPDVTTADSGTLHMDTAPVADPGSTGTHKSLFQTESIALKVRWPVTWALRSALGVAWLTPTWK